MSRFHRSRVKRRFIRRRVFLVREYFVSLEEVGKSGYSYGGRRWAGVARQRSCRGCMGSVQVRRPDCTGTVPEGAAWTCLDPSSEIVGMLLCTASATTCPLPPFGSFLIYKYILPTHALTIQHAIRKPHTIPGEPAHWDDFEGSGTRVEQIHCSSCSHTLFVKDLKTDLTGPHDAGYG